MYHFFWIYNSVWEHNHEIQKIIHGNSKLSLHEISWEWNWSPETVSHPVSYLGASLTVYLDNIWMFWRAEDTTGA